MIGVIPATGVATRHHLPWRYCCSRIVQWPIFDLCLPAIEGKGLREPRSYHMFSHLVHLYPRFSVPLNPVQGCQAQQGSMALLNICFRGPVVRWVPSHPRLGGSSNGWKEPGCILEDHVPSCTFSQKSKPSGLSLYLFCLHKAAGLFRTFRFLGPAKHSHAHLCSGNDAVVVEPVNTNSMCLQHRAVGERPPLFHLSRGLRAEVI
ncbi:hypothetical protein EDC04DRAFT_1021367 [Pisolithus marmoratus]|nr:hypothetical protein EDC04DRAFT_1021367 [Pisolithus marmoratus]